MKTFGKYNLTNSNGIRFMKAMFKNKANTKNLEKLLKVLFHVTDILKPQKEINLNVEM